MGGRRARVAGGGGRDLALDRGSTLTVFTTMGPRPSPTTPPPGTTGTGASTLYSSFVGHPEAESGVLNGLHSVLFNGGAEIAGTAGGDRYGPGSGSAVKAHPSHAYAPPSDRRRTSATAGIGSNNRGGHESLHRPEESHCMGITSVFPVSMPYLGSGGRVCSVSPHDVRMHTCGGMVIANGSNLLLGATCGELLER